MERPGHPADAVAPSRLRIPDIPDPSPSESVVPPLAEVIEQRLTDLEIKASFAEDLVDELNRLVARQQDQLDRLRRELAELRSQTPALDTAAPRDLRAELPPHY